MGKRNDPPTSEQLSAFTEWGIDPPPTLAACALTIRYIRQGFPGHGKLTLDQRVDFYRNCYQTWVGRLVSYKWSGDVKQGRVVSIRGRGIEPSDARAINSVGDMSPLVAIIQCSGRSQYDQCPLNSLISVIPE